MRSLTGQEKLVVICYMDVLTASTHKGSVGLLFSWMRCQYLIYFRYGLGGFVFQLDALSVSYVLQILN